MIYIHHLSMSVAVWNEYSRDAEIRGKKLRVQSRNQLRWCLICILQKKERWRDVPSIQESYICPCSSDCCSLMSIANRESFQSKLLETSGQAFSPMQLKCPSRWVGMATSNCYSGALWVERFRVHSWKSIWASSRVLCSHSPDLRCNKYFITQGKIDSVYEWIAFMLQTCQFLPLLQGSH